VSNTRKRETPMMISGVTRGSSIRKFAGRAPRPRHRARPMARATPMGVAITVVSAASFRVCHRAVLIDGSCQIERSGSSKYQRSENPCHEERDRPSLNENTTATTTGAIVHTM
jgi:hypothetical protein